jgi:hypothetical protein
MSFKHLIFLLTLLRLSSIAGSAEAATIYQVTGLTAMTPSNKGNATIANANQLKIRDTIRSASTTTGANIVQIPAGTYVVTTIAMAQAIHNVTVQGVGNGLDGNPSTTLVKYCSACYGNRPIFRDRDHGSTNYVFKNMAIDMDGIRNFGGITLAMVTGLLIENLHIYDSNPQPYIANGTDDQDRYAIVLFAKNVVIRNNVIEKLQVELNNSDTVLIMNNVSIHPYTTSAFGGFVQHGSSGAFLKNITMSANTVINPESTFAFNINFDGLSTANNATIDNINILNNRIIFTSGLPNHRNNMAHPIFIGVAYFTSTTGNTWNRTTIAGNSIYVHPSVESRYQKGQYMLGQLANYQGFDFVNLTVTNNTVYANLNKPVWRLNHSSGNVDTATYTVSNNVRFAYKDP